MSNEFNESRLSIEKKLSERRLTPALSELTELTKKIGYKRAHQRIQSIADDYSMMLKYLAQGVADPNRNKMFDSFISRAYSVLDSLERFVLRTDDNSLYFSTFRFEAMRPDENVASLVAKLRDESNNSNQDSIAKRLFNRLWVTYPLEGENLDAIDSLLSDDSVSAATKRLVISSLLLGTLRFYDENRVSLMLSTYISELPNESSEIGPMALSAAILSLTANSTRPVSDKLSLLLDQAKLSPTWNADIAAVATELAKTRDTDRINRKMTEELIPGLMKLRPDIARRNLNISDIHDISELEENPEWMEMLNESGIADKMKEMSEIQEEGGDVFMSTFAHLKSFPFFRELPNWFALFEPANPILNTTDSELSANLARILNNSPFLCNSDKYSFFFSVETVPESQRTLMLSQFDTYNNNAAEIRNSELNVAGNSRKNTINKFLQDLFRFFRLYPRHAEFENPFESHFNIFKSKVLTDSFIDMETPTAVAEFFFTHRYYGDALEIFRILEEKSVPSATLYQKIGFCMQKAGEIEEALDYYQRAELIDGRSLWTLKRIASCLTLLGKYEEALDYYRRIDEINPDNPTVSADIANALIGLRRFGEALPLLHKALYLDPANIRLSRVLARTQMLSGDFAGAHKTFNKIIGNHPSANDYLNVGHLSLAEGHLKEAIDFYRMAAANSTVEETSERIIHDTSFVKEIGGNISLLPFVADAVMQ